MYNILTHVSGTGRTALRRSLAHGDGTSPRHWLVTSGRLWTNGWPAAGWSRWVSDPSSDWVVVTLPIGSMYGIFTYIWLIFMVNVGKYSIHGSYGLEIGWFDEKPKCLFGGFNPTQFETYATVKMGIISPRFGVNIKKYLSCHHPASVKKETRWDGFWSFLVRIDWFESGSLR